MREQVDDNHWVVDGVEVRRARPGAPWIVLWQHQQASSRHATLEEAVAAVEDAGVVWQPSTSP